MAEIVLDAYAARKCPVALSLRLQEPQPPKTPSSDMAERRRSDGIRFEQVIFDQILSLYGPDSVEKIDQNPSSDPEGATLQALVSSKKLILGPHLPRDLENGRTGRPDVLLKVDRGWAPIDIKNHRIVELKEESSETSSSLASLAENVREVVPGVRAQSKARLDALQIAHYWLMLEALGFASSDAIGAVIDRDGTAWWFDLTEPRWGKSPARSTLDDYQKQFDLRKRVASNQLERNVDPSIPPLVVPLSKTECDLCEWRDHCSEQMEKSDCVSLIPGVRWTQAIKLRASDVKTRDKAASLDWATASFIWDEGKMSEKRKKVDLKAILDAAKGKALESPVKSVTGKKKIILERFRQFGIETLGDLSRFSREVADIPLAGVGYVPHMIDEATAWKNDTIYRARGIDKPSVKRAAVEIDVDMESYGDRVYLWGTLLTRDSPIAVSDYKAFVSWDQLTPAIEHQVFLDFWNWLKAQSQQCQKAGESIAMYCYSSAENTQMKRIVREIGDPELEAEVEELISDETIWIDLHKIVKEQLVTGRKRGLKVVAPMAGFQWRADDAGGDQSMLWYERAIAEGEVDVAQAAREKLLQYNEDDVRATLEVRRWICQTKFDSL